jgi:hypothetical protein
MEAKMKRRITRVPSSDALGGLLHRRSYLLKKIEAEKEICAEEKARLRAEIDALSTALGCTRLVLNQMPEEQLCKIIAKNDAIHGVPPSPPENVAYRISRAREAIRNEELGMKGLADANEELKMKNEECEDFTTVKYFL